MVDRSDLRVFFGDHIIKFLEIDTSISVLVGIFNHLLQLCLRKSFSNAFTDFCELLNAKGASFAFVKNLEELLKARLSLTLAVETKDLQECLEVHLCVL